tara:strand:- start:1267 stop:1566 length:300 start_codon:yes stop_codon:yes gene_type:complete
MNDYKKSGRKMNDYFTQPIKRNSYFKIIAENKGKDYVRSWMYCVVYQPSVERDVEEFMEEKLKEFEMHVPYDYVDEDLEMRYEKVYMHYSEMVILEGVS